MAGLDSEMSDAIHTVAVYIAIRSRYTRLAWLANPNPNPNLTLLTLATASRVPTRQAVCIVTFM